MSKPEDRKTPAIEPYVDSIAMPENLKVGIMIAEARAKCSTISCPFDYHAFAFGQSPFPVPEPLVQALKDSAALGHYSAAEGIEQLRVAIADFNKRHFGIDVEPGRIVVGPGTKSLIHDVFFILQGGVIIPSPSWIGYFPQVRLMSKHFHTLPLRPENGYRIDPDQLDHFVSRLHAEQHILVLNNPHNPTGAVYTEQHLRAIAEVARKHNILIVADEIYALSTYEFDRFVSMAKIYPEGTFVTNGLSKDRSAGGYRLGYVVLPENGWERLADAFRKVAATVFTNTATPIQYAAVKAFQPNETIERYFEATRGIHRAMGTYLSKAFAEIEGLEVTMPEGGFYFFVNFNGIKDALRKKGVSDSNSLAHALLSHPYHFAAVTGDACLLDPDDYGARIAFVDYDGAAALEAWLASPPSGPDERARFVEKHAPRMVEGIATLKRWVKDMVG